MTENKATEILKQPCYCDYDLSATIETCEVSSCDRRDAMRTAIKALEEIQSYRAIGTVEEFKFSKKSQSNKCKDCAGCTDWKCDCANERYYAINEFANFLHEKAKGNNGLRLSSETRSWTHASIFDYVNEFKAEQLKGEKQ